MKTFNLIERIRVKAIFTLLWLELLRWRQMALVWLKLLRWRQMALAWLKLLRLNTNDLTMIWSFLDEQMALVIEASQMNKWASWNSMFMLHTYLSFFHIKIDIGYIKSQLINWRIQLGRDTFAEPKLHLQLLKAIYWFSHVFYIDMLR